MPEDSGVTNAASRHALSNLRCAVSSSVNFHGPCMYSVVSQQMMSELSLHCAALHIALEATDVHYMGDEADLVTFNSI